MKNKETFNISETDSLSKQQDLNLLNFIAISALFINISSFTPDENKKEPPKSLEENKETIHEDLHSIHELESSSGANLEHPVVNYGLNKGDRAGGGFGVMPITARETVSKNPSLKKKYSHILNMSNKQITLFLNNNKTASKEIANLHWKRLTKLFPKDRLRRAYAWNCGITCALKASSKEVIDSKYVKKFIKVSNKKISARF